jgi:hypothetical protein
VTLLGDLRHAPIDPPWKRVRLERDSFQDYRQRSVSANLSVAELYHENSKWFPQMHYELVGLRTDLPELRRRVIQERAASEGSGVVCGWNGVLTAVRDASDLFYAVELRVAAEDVLTVFEPISDTLQPVKRLSAGDWTVLRAASELADDGGPLGFLLGRFVWNDVLFGPRGYRRTLLEAGRLAQEIARRAEQLGMAFSPACEFTDRDVDLVMEADGIDEGTLMLFALGGRGDGVG